MVPLSSFVVCVVKGLVRILGLGMLGVELEVGRAAAMAVGMSDGQISRSHNLLGVFVTVSLGTQNSMPGVCSSEE
jgi:hypothetical protein